MYGVPSVAGRLGTRPAWQYGAVALATRGVGMYAAGEFEPLALSETVVLAMCMPGFAAALPGLEGMLVLFVAMWLRLDYRQYEVASYNYMAVLFTTMTVAAFSNVVPRSERAEGKEDEALALGGFRLVPKWADLGLAVAHALPTYAIAMPVGLAIGFLKFGVATELVELCVSRPPRRVWTSLTPIPGASSRARLLSCPACW